MNSVYLRITDKCNLKCRHCCYDCGPDGKSISLENLEKVIDNIPEDTEHLTLSGGEVFTERKLLMHAMDYISKKNEKRKKEISVKIATNGFWIRDAGQTFRILHELYDKGLRKLTIGSNDKFHREQGIKVETLDTYGDKGPLGKAVKMLEEAIGFSEALHISIPYASPVQVFALPFGRGKSLPAKEIDNTRICIATESFPNGITINPDGKVYPCCWAATPSIGSALEDNLNDIARKAMKDKIFKRLLTEGPRGVAKEIGYYKRSDEPLYRSKQCMMCMEVFEEIRKNESI